MSHKINEIKKKSKDIETKKDDKHSVARVCGDLKKLCKIGRKLKEDKEKQK